MGKTFISVAALAAAALASPASAATIIACGGGSNCVTGTTNVNLVAANDVTSGTGNIGIGGPVVNFSTTQVGGFDLITGQASITAANPNNSLDNLFFSVATGFTAAEFNFNPLTGGGAPAPFSVTISTNTGSNQTFDVGNQRFGILAAAGETITSVQITTPTGAFGAFTQLRITPAAVTAVPEPGTWAMMLVGFGAVGASMRRRRRNNAGTLAQMA
jgi:hypothetical protein